MDEDVVNPPQTSQERQAELSIERAQAYLQSGQADKALLEFQEAQRIAPELGGNALAAYLMQTGDARLAAGDDDEALSIFRRAMAAAPPGPLRQELNRRINGLYKTKNFKAPVYLPEQKAASKTFRKEKTVVRDQSAPWQVSPLRGPQAGRRYPIADNLRIGRSSENEICLNSHDISRRHAQIERMADGIQVTDLGSTNGTHVNGIRIRQPTKLRNGDIITICDTELVVIEPSQASVPPEAQAIVFTFAQQTFCQHCGKPLAPDADLCDECGHKT